MTYLYLLLLYIYLNSHDQDYISKTVWSSRMYIGNIHGCLFYIHSFHFVQVLPPGYLTSFLFPILLKLILIRIIHHNWYTLMVWLPISCLSDSQMPLSSTHTILATHICTWHTIVYYPYSFIYPLNPLHVLTLHIFIMFKMPLSPLGVWQRTTQFLWDYLL